MAMPSVLVTLCESGRSIDLELPGDIPISKLVPLLQEVLASVQAGDDCTALNQGDPWSNAATALPPDYTLVACGIVDGSVIVLQDAQLWVEHLQPIAVFPSVQYLENHQENTTTSTTIHQNTDGSVP
jgi:hypothetical protein